MKIKCPKCESKFYEFGKNIKYYGDHKRWISRFYFAKNLIDCPNCGVRLRESKATELIRNIWLLFIPFFITNTLIYNYSEPGSILLDFSGFLLGPLFFVGIFLSFACIIKNSYEVISDEGGEYENT